MTERIKTLTVHLEDNVREDDAEVIANAIRCIVRVSQVVMNTSELEDMWALGEAKRQIREQIWGVLQ